MPGSSAFEKWHDTVVDGTRVIILHHVEKLVRLVVHSLQMAVGGQHVQPVGIEQVDLAGEIAKRRELAASQGT